ncbi:hypothetical protein QAD02_017792 [Eretmocerus hayati]|uniref:Uncharacterized protein n=1 Tax=Eretmocerus hayati TaxID=131215 RepID=A0ACC2PEK7_9HYME|nr:hypothetical protein QAD02_017792 [Eretmocerus hayati]
MKSPIIFFILVLATIAAAFHHDPLLFHFAQALEGEHDLGVNMEGVANGINRMDLIDVQDDYVENDDDDESIIIDHFNHALVGPYNVDNEDDELVRIFDEAIENELEIETRRRRFRERRFIQRSLRHASDPFDVDPESFRRLYR